MIEKTKDLAVEMVPGSEVVYGAFGVSPGAFGVSPGAFRVSPGAFRVFPGAFCLWNEIREM